MIDRKKHQAMNGVRDADQSRNDGRDRNDSEYRFKYFRLRTIVHNQFPELQIRHGQHA
nr:MAG TPA: hypothetical protein [Caudoviricetes sp.]